MLFSYREKNNLLLLYSVLVVVVVAAVVVVAVVVAVVIIILIITIIILIVQHVCSSSLHLVVMATTIISMVCVFMLQLHSCQEMLSSQLQNAVVDLLSQFITVDFGKLEKLKESQEAASLGTYTCIALASSNQLAYYQLAWCVYIYK